MRIDHSGFLALACCLPALAAGQAEVGAPTVLEAVVVTAPGDPTSVTIDPRAQRQSLPARDGADALKGIPGLSVIRKGGSGGDPVFRGMVGSRLNILADGEVILGGCGGRMDPPTTYIHPEAYDRITLVKGPQTVLWGAGNSAGVVLFERDFIRMTGFGQKLAASLAVGSFGQHDETVDYSVGNAAYSARLSGTRAAMDDYRDGDGKEVHSRHRRWSGDAVLGWTPDDDTRLQLSAGASDGEAAYADRPMDGVQFRRDHAGLKFVRKKISPLLTRLDAQVYHSRIDHVMDNYSLRERVAGLTRQVNNTERETTGLRVAAALKFGAETSATVGMDHQQNIHAQRFSGNQDRVSYEDFPRIEDARFANTGFFGEFTWALTAEDRLVAGLRADAWQARDQRRGYVTAGEQRRTTLTSGFLRHERDFGAESTWFLGIGYNERFPDYWELISQGKQSLSTNSAFDTRPEKRTQIDLGTTWHPTRQATISLSGFYGKVEDYILIDDTRKLKLATLTRNVDAATWGAEAGFDYRFRRTWRGEAALAWVRGENHTDHAPLAQMPPLEFRLALDYDDGVHGIGALLRLVDGQDRVDPGRGSIVGRDIGPTPGFAVVSLNGSYRPHKTVLLTAGIDNLFDRRYAEHLSRAGWMVAGYAQTGRVNEPGRTVWFRARVTLE